MYLIDTHCHLYAEEFDNDRQAVVQNAIDAGVKKILLPNVEAATFDRMMHLSLRFPEYCFPMMGLHPCSVKENFEEELAFAKRELFAESQRFYAIGEIGMDLYWDKSTFEIQTQAFIRQCKWALELELPVSIHSRNATR